MRPVRSGVQLAEPMTGPKLAKLGQCVVVQPKLNGDRCRTLTFGEEIFLVSSYGNEFRHLKHINKAIKEQWPEGLPWPDGELYKHGMRLEDIHSRVSRSVNVHDGAGAIEYHIFDYQGSDDQLKRMAALARLELKPPLFVVRGEAIENNRDLVTEKMSQYVRDGYEGVIVRDLFSPYTPKRIPGMLKYKPHCEDEYKILAVKEGEGWCRGMLGSFTVAGDDGQPFDIGSGALLTKKNRILLWKIKERLIGEMLTVKYEPQTTRRGIPKCAVAVGLRRTF